ncbi:iron ABC transporter permease [Bremerella cremea]|uniref:Iron ABC transporter permease n=1 Tax=Bremerella cremea TaxID=1031537 RepID=A0A368KLX9_9BACT|nr:iron ABC transporter permease [Bremerella cremea]RCS42179.1 iron ABC transporter permease [Bremerella cremea]
MTAVGLLLVVLCVLLLLWGDPLSISLTANSLKFALATVACTLPLAIVTALLIFRTNIVGRAVLQTLLVVWLFIPVYIHIAGWRNLFGPQGWLEIANPLNPSANLIDGWTGVLWLHCVAAFPWAVLLTGIAFGRGPASLEDDAQLEISPLAVLTRVTLRRSWDAVLVAIAWLVIAVFGEMSIASVCNVRTYAEVVFTGIPLGQTASETGLTIAPGVLVIVGLVLLAAWSAETLRPREPDAETRRPAPIPLGKPRWFWSLLVWLLFLAALGPPLIGLVYKVGITINQVNGDFIRGWSLLKAIGLTASSVVVYRPELMWTLAIGGTVALVTTLLGLLLSDLAMRNRAGAWFVTLLCAALFALPGPIVGLSIAWGTNRPWLAGLAPLIDRSIFAPVLAILTITLPIVTFYYWHAFASQRQLREMAAIDGSNWWRTWTRVILPGNVSTIVAGALMGFVLACNDVAASVLVLPAGIDTISRRIFGLLHFGGEDNVAGILLMNLLVVAILASVICTLAGGTRRSDFGDSLP